MHSPLASRAKHLKGSEPPKFVYLSLGIDGALRGTAFTLATTSPRFLEPPWASTQHLLALGLAHLAQAGSAFPQGDPPNQAPTGMMVGMAVHRLFPGSRSR